MNPELEDLKKALQVNPRDSQLLRKLGKYYLNAGYYKQAKEEYHLAALFNPRLSPEIQLDHEYILEKNVHNLQARLSLASFCLSCGEVDSAISEMQEILEIDPQNVMVYNILGRVLIKLERMDDAQDLLERALFLGIKNLSISEMLAGVYLEKGKYEEAVKFFEELPQNKNTLRTLGELYTRLKRYEAAAEKFSSMFTDDPEVSSEVILKLEDLLLKDEKSLRIREILADIYTRSLKPEQAVAKLSEIASLNPGRLKEIIEKLKRMLKNYPHHAEIGLALAEAQIQSGNYSEAIEAYQDLVKTYPDLLPRAISGCQKILSRYPQQFMARQFLAEAHLKLGEYQSALSELKSILSFYKEGADWVIGKCRDLLKKEPHTREVLGYAYLAKGDFSRAALEAETLLAADRNFTPAHVLLGKIYLEQRLCRKSQESFHKALSLDPNNPEIHQMYKESRGKELSLEIESLKKRLVEDEWKISLHLDLGKIYLQLQKNEEALRELQLALKDTARAPFVYQLMGQLYCEEGRFDLAVSSLKKGLQITGPELSDLQKKLKFALALSYEAQGLVKHALKTLEEIQQEDLDFPGLSEKIKYLKGTGVASLQNKLLVAASQNFESRSVIGFWGRASKAAHPRATLDISFGQNYNLSGLEYFMRGMFEAAQEQFSLSVQLDPNFVVSLNNLGVTLLINRRSEEALHRFRSAFELDPSSAVIASNLGLTYALLGQNTEALKWLEKALAVDRELAAAQLNLGDVLYASNQAAKALEAYQKIPGFDILTDLAQRRLQYKLP